MWPLASFLYTAGQHPFITAIFVILSLVTIWTVIAWWFDGQDASVGCAFVFFFLLSGGAFIVLKLLQSIEGDPLNPKTIIFAGRVSQTNQQRWLNDRLVIMYAQNGEVGRSKTQVAAFRKVVETPTDGVFSVSVGNLYSLRPGDFSNCKSMEFELRTAYCWLGEFKEDAGGVELPIVNKKLKYAMRFLPGDYDALPEELKEDGITGLVEGNIVVVASKPTPPGWWDTILGRKPSAPPTQERVPNVVETVQYDPRPEVVDLPAQAETAFLNNCKGNETVRQSITDSKTFVREYTVQVSANLGIPIEVVELQLGAQGGYRQKQISTKTVHYELQAKPGTNVSYKIRWRETWRKGVVMVRGKKGVVKLPFRVRQDVQSQLEAGSQNCVVAAL